MSGTYRKMNLNFRNPIEFIVIIILLLYSMVVTNAYFLNFFDLNMSVFNITFILVIEFVLFISLSNIKFAFEANSTIYCLGIFSIVFIYSFSHSPDFMPVSFSVDAVHHYVLMDYFYDHESLPDLSYSYYMQEMVQYPYGPSLFTVYFSKIFGIELVKVMQILVFAAAGLLAVLVYLIGGELLHEYDIPAKSKDIISIAGPFMLFSIPKYFIGQYLESFYYSMVFGSVLVLGTLLAFQKIERKEYAWINLYFILSLGIIFTYPLFIIIPVFAAAIWLFFKSNNRKLLGNKLIFTYLILLSGVFILYSLERINIGKAILLNEGYTLVPDISNFNPIFIILVISGIILYGIENEEEGVKRIAIIYIVILFLEPYFFLFINKFGLIAKYFAYKTMYLQVLIMSPFICIPIAYLIKHIDNYNFINKKRFSDICLFGTLFIITLFSLYTLAAYQVNSQPILTINDIKLSKYTANYRFENNMADGNITIIAPNLASYWIGNGFLHMEKEYAIQKFLTNKKMGTIEEWMNNTKSSYLLTRIEYININYFKNNVNFKFLIEHREGNTVLLKKT